MPWSSWSFVEHLGRYGEEPGGELEGPVSGEGGGGLGSPVSLFWAEGTRTRLMDRWDIRSVAVAGSAWCGGMLFEPHPKTTMRKARTDGVVAGLVPGVLTMITRYTLAITSGRLWKETRFITHRSWRAIEHPRATR